MEGLELKKQGE
ncbi:hypothetical protein CGLO_17993 [Colletotrichum gloeosporioides Cg-14]|uniref:Uncharacterized protein n=1 Tax=Colletotrichum gloeosporioides (strain Cg-14) TaxID=1237896 RepID=T0JS65_COLGC|nr:hypothetical protein CGLO_17993 [Colletotrichum gloeosporioides Cg-14]